MQFQHNLQDYNVNILRARWHSTFSSIVIEVDLKSDK